MGTLTYNERSWAIDVISQINAFALRLSKPIRRAGGEVTLRSTQKSLFPDILLYGDERSGSILQGWELKMPNTPINDFAFIQNAEQKARLLNLNSFLIWNANTAHLYILTADGKYEIKESWNTPGITTREQVKENEEGWISTLYEILTVLNDYFEQGILRHRTAIDISKVSPFVKTKKWHV
ncbi:MAG: hypothetical protein Kow0090_16940 [Myxococcota bacterium]